MNARTAGERRPTQEERRTATRARVAGAAADCLAQDGQAMVTTRAVAQRAGVSQATVMHYFATRVQLLSDAMGLLCDRILDEVQALSAQPPPDGEGGPTMLDHFWEQFKSPSGVAIAQVWCAGWSDPELTPVVANFDRRHIEATTVAMRRASPPDVDPEQLSAYVELVLATMKGILLLRPVTTAAELDARWDAVRPALIRAGYDLKAGTDDA